MKYTDQFAFDVFASKSVGFIVDKWALLHKNRFFSDGSITLEVDVNGSILFFTNPLCPGS